MSNKLTAIQAFQLLTSICEAEGISMSLDYDNGKYIPGEFLDPNNPGAEPKPEYIKQGPAGWKITVGGYSINDLDTGEDKLSVLGQALASGVGIAYEILKKVTK